MPREVAYGPVVLSMLVAAESTTTTMPNVVGEPLASSWILLAGFALLVAIVFAGLWVRRRAS